LTDRHLRRVFKVGWLLEVIQLKDDQDEYAYEHKK
jgi:hypothetical protein